MRALVVGRGRMGAFHEKVLRDLGYDVTTVDPEPARGADFATVEEALPKFDEASWQPTTSRFDVAVVAVPPEHLLDTAYRLAGTPKLLIEKPFALNTRNASMLAAYLKASGSAVCVG